MSIKASTTEDVQTVYQHDFDNLLPFRAPPSNPADANVTEALTEACARIPCSAWKPTHFTAKETECGCSSPCFILSGSLPCMAMQALHGHALEGYTACQPAMSKEHLKHS